MEPKIYYHNPEAVQQRNFDASKNYWWPIPRYELNKINVTRCRTV